VSKSNYTHTYHLNFDTLDMPGAITCVEIKIRKAVKRDHDVMRVDLADHPLYPALQEYVLMNPRPRRKLEKN